VARVRGNLAVHGDMGWRMRFLVVGMCLAWFGACQPQRPQPVPSEPASEGDPTTDPGRSNDALVAALAKLRSADVDTQAAGLAEAADACLAESEPPFDRTLAALLSIMDPPTGEMPAHALWAPGQDALGRLALARANRKGWRVAWPADLAGLADHDLLRTANRLLWYGVSIYDGPDTLNAGLEAATPGQRALFSIVWLESEVNNGGFDQLFWNSTGVVWAEALRGFELIGATRHLELLRKAAAKMPGGAVPGDQSERQEVVDGLPEGSFGELTDAFFELGDSPDHAPTRLLAAYIRANPAEFFEGPTSR